MLNKLGLFHTKKEAAVKTLVFVLTNAGVFAFLWSISKLINR